MDFEKVAADIHFDEDDGYALMLSAMAKQAAEPFDEDELIGETHARKELKVRLEGLAEWTKRSGL